MELLGKPPKIADEQETVTAIIDDSDLNIKRSSHPKVIYNKRCS